MDMFKGIMRMAKSKQLASLSGLLGALCIHLIVGAIYRWNMITGYVGTFYGTEYVTPIGAPLSMLCVGLTMRLGYKLSNDRGSECVMLFAMTVITSCTIVSSYMPSFPRAVLFGALNIECVEYENDSFQMSESELRVIVEENFGGCIFRMGFYVLAIGFLGILMMIPLIRRNAARELEERELSMEERGGNFCRGEREAFHSRVFWSVGAIIFLTSCGNYYIIMNFKNLLAA
ncbi:unnamed protein product [Sphagnum balticum]